ncbi:ABC transporter ATP-binding protein [Micrococcus terreus]|uniref:iron ABC transporter ATP-binding protein n=1 Tax=Micrococcus terreus TaxID=574650 RepID=UPI0023F687BD|nr:ATP-binding cassette domain-containing protein [Micrococcus terreus]
MAVQTEDELTAGTLDGMDARQSGPQAPGAPVANGSHSIHADPPVPGVPAIDLQGVVKAYDRTRVVDEVTAQIPAGGVTSIIGPNGAGKSTLLSMVGRLLQADGGTIAVGGQDVFDSDTRELARKLAVLRQENTTTVRLTVWDLVSFGRFPHHGGRPGPDDERLVSQALGYMDLHSFAGRYLDELSGGQRQRAYIAMVLAQDTDVLLLDEPLNNLDMKHAVEMMRLIRRMADELGKTVVIVIHDINFASCYSDTILAMKSGRLVHQGSPDQLMCSETLQDIYDVDILVEEIRGKKIGIYFS